MYLIMSLKSFWCRFKKFIVEKNFSNGELCIFFGIFMWYIFTSTELFNTWDDYFKVIYWGGGMLIGWIMGRMGFRRLKDVLEKAEHIIYRPDYEIDEKYAKVVELIHRACYYLGNIFEQFNRRQGTGIKSKSQPKEEQPLPTPEPEEQDKKKD